MKRINLFFLSLLACLLVGTNSWGATETIGLPTSFTQITNSSTWSAKIAEANKQQEPEPAAITAIFANRGAGLYDGVQQGKSTEVIKSSTLSSSAFTFIGRGGYAGSFAAYVYIPAANKNVTKITANFSTGTNLGNATFSIWQYKNGSATKLAYQTLEANHSAYEITSSEGLNLNSSDKIIFVWNSGSYGNDNPITDFSATLTTEDRSGFNVSLTDQFGNVYSSFYETDATTTAPTIAGVEGLQVYGGHFETDGSYAAHIGFPFSVSNAETGNNQPTFIMSYNSKWFAKTSGTNDIAFASNEDNTSITSSNVNNYLWYIYPTFVDGNTFSLKIYNVGFQKYIPNNVGAGYGSNCLLTSDVASAGSFQYKKVSTGNNGYGFYKVSDKKYLTINSVNAADQNIWLWTSSGTNHQGSNMSFPALPHISNSFDDAVWYNMSVRKKYKYYDGTKYPTASKGTDASFYFAFIKNGNDATKFRIIDSNNKELGETNPMVPVGAGQGSVFENACSDKYYYLFHLTTQTNAYVHDLGDNIGVWNSTYAKGDPGSGIVLDVTPDVLYYVNMAELPDGTTVSYNGTTLTKSSTVTSFKAAAILTAADFTVTLPSGYHCEKTLTGRTLVVETYPDRDIAIEEATTVLNKRGVGYPKVSTEDGSPYKTLNDYITNLTTDWNLTAYKDLKTAIANYKASTDVQLPETGKVYTIAFKTYNNGQYSGQYYMYDNGEGNIATSANLPTNHLAATYLAIEDGSKHLLKSGTGCFGGINKDNNPWSTSASSSTYDAAIHQITFAALKNNTSTKVSKQVPDGTIWGKNNQNYVFIAYESGATNTRSNLAFFDGSYTSALSFEESTEYNAYKVVFADGTAAGASVTFDDGVTSCVIEQPNGESTTPYIPYFITANNITDEAGARAVLTPSAGTEFSSVSVSGKVITVLCVKTATTFTTHIIPSNLAGAGVVVGGDTYTDGQTFEFEGTPVWGTDITGAEVTGYEVVKHELHTNDIYVYYNRVKNQLWTTTSTEGERYRIPALAVTATGKLIAVTDKRRGGDIGGGNHTSLRFRTSDDNGANWSEVKQLATWSGSEEACAYSDAAIVADIEEANKIVAFSTSGPIGYNASSWTKGGSNYLATSRHESNDGGETWETTNLDDTFYQMFENSATPITGLFFTSGRILQSRYVKVGDNYRIYAVLTAKPNGNRVIYSDDFGQNWNALGGINALPCPNGNEAKVEELPDGRILLSSRKASGRYFNVYTYTNTATGEGYWQAQTEDHVSAGGLSASSSACNGEILIVPAERKSDSEPCYLLLQSVPTGSDRVNVSIFYKELLDAADFANVSTLATNWDGSYQVSTTTSAYSTMILQNDNKIGFYYEENAGNDGYQMAYVPLSLELITNNTYCVDNESHRLEVVKGYLADVVGGWTEGNYVGQTSAALKTEAQGKVNAWTSAPTSAQLDEVFGAVNKLTPNNFYRFVCAYPAYSVKKAIYADASDYLWKWKNRDAEDVTQVFYYVENEDKKYFYNVNDGFYPAVQPNQSGTISTSLAANAFALTELGSYQYNIRTIGSGYAFHTGGHDNGKGISGNIVTWDGGVNTASSWYIECVASTETLTNALATRATESKTSLQTAIDDAKKLEKGPEIGKIADESGLAAAITKAQGVHDADPYVKIVGDLAYATLEAEVHECYAKPTVGRFYTFQNQHGDKRYLLSSLSTTDGKTDLLACSTTPGDDHKNIFTVVEGNKLQGYTTGNYATRVDGSGNTNMMGSGTDVANATPFTFIIKSNIHHFLLDYPGSDGKTYRMHGAKEYASPEEAKKDDNGFTFEVVDVTDKIYNVVFTTGAPDGSSVKLGNDRVVTPAMVGTNAWIYSDNPLDDNTEFEFGTVSGYVAKAKVTDKTITVTYEINIPQGFYHLSRTWEDEGTKIAFLRNETGDFVEATSWNVSSIIYVDENGKLYSQGTEKTNEFTVVDASTLKRTSTTLNYELTNLNKTPIQITTNKDPQSSKKYATLCVPFPLTFNDNYSEKYDAYICKSNTTSAIELQKITSSDRTISAGVPVIIYSSNAALLFAVMNIYLGTDSENPTYTYEKTGGIYPTGGDDATVQLNGNYTQMEAGSNYAFGVYDNVVGFYKKAPKTGESVAYISANKAFLSSKTGSIKGYTITFEEELPTLIEQLEAADNPDAIIYNLGGQKLNKLQKGINIVNGQKVYVK